MDILGKRPTKRNEQHLSVETRHLLKERTVIKRKEPTAENRANYSKINKMVKKSCKSDDNNWASRIHVLRMILKMLLCLGNNERCGRIFLFYLTTIKRSLLLFGINLIS